MSTSLETFLIQILGNYDFTVKWDVPYITRAVLLAMGVWFAFRVILTLMHILGGGKK